jgi:3-methyladenine DNA glycosylase AlkD
MSLAETIVDRLVPTLTAAADPELAPGMSAYLRNQFPCHGIPMKRRRELTKEALAGLPTPAEDDLVEVSRLCWALPERDYQYFVLDWLTKHVRIAGPVFLDTARELITTKSWWDTVDPLASHVVGGIVATHPDSVAVMDSWAHDENLWLARTALLHQLRRKATTDTGRLFGYCTALAGERDFFIRKAIGWALRTYAWTDPDAVREYVAAQPGLSPLSVREALKHL